MGNYRDYLKEFGNKSFMEAPLNEVDALLFSIISYIDFKTTVPKTYLGKGISLSEIVKAFENQTVDIAVIGKGEQEELLKGMAEAKRFENITVNSYSNVYDSIKEVQFSAICVYLDEKTVLLVYRGTDSTIIGWKENLALSYAENVEAQKSALQYSNFIYNLHPECEYYIAGHSKGGNLAVYTGMKTNIPKEQIRQIWSFDGPGFSNEELIRLIDENSNKIAHIIPGESFVGMLLTSPGEYITIKSNAKAIWQHDGFSWEIEGDHFFRLKDVSNNAFNNREVLSEWLSHFTREQREEFSEAVYEYSQLKNAVTLQDLNFASLEGKIKLLFQLKDLDERPKKVLLDGLKLLVSIWIAHRKANKQ